MIPKLNTRVRFPSSAPGLKPVVLHSDALFSAFFDAGLPVDRFCYDGPDCGKLFLLDEHDRLTEWSEDDAG
jgi:hypothetical protein